MVLLTISIVPPGWYRTRYAPAPATEPTFFLAGGYIHRRYKPERAAESHFSQLVARVPTPRYEPGTASESHFCRLAGGGAGDGQVVRPDRNGAGHRLQWSAAGVAGFSRRPLTPAPPAAARARGGCAS